MDSQDAIKIEILADGTLKVTTDPISAANHMNAEDLLQFLQEKCGGSVSITARDPHQHSHHLSHVHN